MLCCSPFPLHRIGLTSANGSLDFHCCVIYPFSYTLSHDLCFPTTCSLDAFLLHDPWFFFSQNDKVIYPPLFPFRFCVCHVPPHLCVVCRALLPQSFLCFDQFPRTCGFCPLKLFSQYVFRDRNTYWPFFRQLGFLPFDVKYRGRSHGMFSRFSLRLSDISLLPFVPRLPTSPFFPNPPH